MSFKACYEDIENGYYDGSIVHQLTTENKELCGIRCCDNAACELWVWRSRDQKCHLKKKDNLAFHSDSAHWTAKKSIYMLFKLCKVILFKY